MDLDGGYLKALLRRAQSNMELEAFEEAVQDYEKAHRLDRQNGDIRRSENNKSDFPQLLFFGPQADVFNPIH